MSVNDDMLQGGSDSFWEVDCYKRTVKRHEDGMRLCSELMQLIQERADIEKHYSKSLRTWSKKWGDAIDKGPEYGTTQGGWKGCLSEADSMSDLHNEIKDSLLSNVQAQISQWKKENFHKPMVGPCKETKQLEDDFKKAQKPWSKKLAKMIDSKKKYHMACKMEKTATNQENNAKGDSAVSSDALKKLNEKADKCRKEVEGTKEKYKEMLLDLDRYTGRYVEDMKDVFNRSQEMEEKRLKFFKEMLFGIHHSLDLSDKPVMPQIYSQLNHTIDQADFLKDLKWWSQNHGVDMPMHWPDFEEYSTEFHAISRKEKSKASTAEGITLTAIQKNESHVAPKTHNTPPAQNNHTAPPVQSHVAPVQRQMSYDPSLNPFEDEMSGEDLEAPLLQRNSVKDSEPIAQNTKLSSPACDKKSSKESLNPFEDEERSNDKKPPRPSKKSKKQTNAGQNPFGDDDWEEYDNQGLQDDGSEGMAVRAIYDYDGQEEDELTFKVGEVFVMLKNRDDQGWCTGRKDGKVGLYPDNYVEVLGGNAGY